MTVSRPRFRKKTPAAIVALATDMWDERPEQRCTFAQALHRLQAFMDELARGGGDVDRPPPSPRARKRPEATKGPLPPSVPPNAIADDGGNKSGSSDAKEERNELALSAVTLS